MHRDLPASIAGSTANLNPAIAGLESALALAEGADPISMVGEVQRHFLSLSASLGSADDAEKRSAMLACTRAALHFHASCMPESTTAAASLAGALARDLGGSSELRKALVIEAIGLCELGEFARAVIRLNEALDIAIATEDLYGQCTVWNQLGLLLHQQGQAKEAADAFGKVLEIADKDASLLRSRTVALTNLAMLGLDVPEFAGRALGAALSALALSPSPSSPLDFYNQVSLEAIAARLLSAIGNLDAAQKHAAAAMAHAEHAGDRALALAHIAVGTVEVAAGKSSSGIEKLRSAVELARRKVKVLHFFSLRALIAAYEATGQVEVAKVYLEELLRLSREQKEQQLLEQHHKHVAAIIRSNEGEPDLFKVDIQRQRERLASDEISRESVRSMMLLLEEHANAAELHDDSTSKHIYRVGRMSALIAKEIGLDENTQFMLDLSARLHDTGKLFVPDAILLKPGKLTDSERAIMQTHTTSGAEYLRKTGLPMIEVATEIALCHHERFDGKGYPAGLKGSAIPISARIAALADVFDALTHERPYKSAWSIPEALAEIRSLRGTHFDPDLTDVFLSLVPRLQHETGDLDSFLAAEAENSRFVQTRRALAAKLKGIDPAVSAFELRR
jgi:putative two-component system response regulator